MRTINIKSINENAFVPMVKRRNIIKARVLSKKEKATLEPGSPDILTVSLIGERKTISRSEIIEKYRYISGNKISLSGWKVGREYLLMCEDNISMKGLVVPKDIKIVSEGVIRNRKVVNSGEYIVCNVDENNSITDDMYYISKKLFRKMFIVLPSERLKVSKRKGKANITRIDNDKQSNSILNTQRKEVTERVNSKEPKGIKYKAIGRLTNNEGKIVGFLLIDNKKISHQVSKMELMELCNRKLVVNITVAIKETTGTKYLRGNGIKISELKEYRV